MDNNTWVWIISIGVSILFFLGIPIFLIIGLWVVGISLVIDFTLANIGVTLYEGLNFYGLLALPLFILTGDLIKAAGIAQRLSDFAYSVLGWLRGGLAMSALGACGMFAAISGSNSATTATIGSIMHPEMTKGGYDKHFAAATIAAGGTVGIIIPPSIIFIVYGFLMNLSISDLFVGGLLPGVLMVIAMQIACYVVCKKNGWGELISFSPKNSLIKGGQAYLGFMAIFIVIFGIYGGIFSPTEAAGVTAGFCLLSGIFITKGIKIKNIPKIIFAFRPNHRLIGALNCCLNSHAANFVFVRCKTICNGNYKLFRRLLPNFVCLHVIGFHYRYFFRNSSGYNNISTYFGTNCCKYRNRSNTFCCCLSCW